MVSALLITLAGARGRFARVMDRIPPALTSALLAGVLARFAFDAFASLQREFTLVAVMFVAYLLGHCAWPRYAVPVLLAAGIALAALKRQVQFCAVQWALDTPVFTAPSFSLTLHPAHTGDRCAADGAYTKLYQDLLTTARARLRAHQPNTLLDTQVLVRESYLRFISGNHPEVQDRRHFLPSHGRKSIGFGKSRSACNTTRARGYPSIQVEAAV